MFLFVVLVFLVFFWGAKFLSIYVVVLSLGNLAGARLKPGSGYG